MVREDILWGLRNAIEKGESFEKAKQSFINAGYSREEVEEAASFINTGVLPEKEDKSLETPSSSPPSPSMSPQTGQDSKQVKKPKDSFFNKLKRNYKIVVLLIILLILIAILILVLIFKEKIIGLFT